MVVTGVGVLVFWVVAVGVAFRAGGRVMLYEAMYNKRWFTKPLLIVKNDGVQNHSQRTMVVRNHV